MAYKQVGRAAARALLVEITAGTRPTGQPNELVDKKVCAYIYIHKRHNVPHQMFGSESGVSIGSKSGVLDVLHFCREKHQMILDQIDS